MNPTFSVFGTISGGPPVPPPDRFAYVSWSDFVDAPRDLAITGSNDDSATVHYWGYTAPLVIAAGASAGFTEYISTVQGSIGFAGGGVVVPTLSQWALAALAVLLAIGGLASLSRRVPPAG